MSDPELDEWGRPGQWVLTGNPRRVRLAPIDELTEMDGFRLARVFETPRADGLPRVDPARGRMTDVEERRTVLGYLEAATVIDDLGTHSNDLLDPRRAAAIPNRFRTDGRWIWDDSVAYYLRWHLVPPEPDFLAHIAAAGDRPRPVDRATAAAALRALTKADAIHVAQRDRWMVEQRMVASTDRFPQDVQKRLFHLGWRPDRDISADVERWLDRRLPELRQAYRRRGDEAAAPEPFAAARTVFAEFGGLSSRESGMGVTSARVPFVIFPPPPGEWRDLLSDPFTVLDKGRRLGRPVFQLGYIEDGSALLVIAEDGSVHLAGSVSRLVGETFDQAIVALLDGDLPADPNYPSPGPAR